MRLGPSAPAIFSFDAPRRILGVNFISMNLKIVYFLELVLAMRIQHLFAIQYDIIGQVALK